MTVERCAALFLRVVGREKQEHQARSRVSVEFLNPESCHTGHKRSRSFLSLHRPSRRTVTALVCTTCDRRNRRSSLLASLQYVPVDTKLCELASKEAGSTTRMLSSRRTGSMKKRRVSEDVPAVDAGGAAVQDSEPTPMEVPSQQPQQQDPYSHLTPIQKLLITELFRDNPAAVETALERLAELCYSSDGALAADAEERNRDEVQRKGGEVVLSGVMKKWRDYAAIQAKGLDFLQRSALDVKANGSGLLDDVIYAMNRYPDNRDVQCHACGALSELVCMKENAEYVTIGEYDGAKMIVAAMKKFPADAELQKNASWALDNLAQWDDAKVRGAVNKAGARLALVSAIEKHEQDEDGEKEDVDDLQERAKSALIALLS